MVEVENTDVILSAVDARMGEQVAPNSLEVRRASLRKLRGDRLPMLLDVLA
jgi:hypothetical protein